MYVTVIYQFSWITAEGLPKHIMMYVCKVMHIAESRITAALHTSVKHSTTFAETIVKPVKFALS